MNDYGKLQTSRAAKEAREAAGLHPRGSKADAIDAALMRYLAAEEYHEKVEETREAEGESGSSG